MMCVGAVVTDFTCTNGTVCAGDIVECYCLISKSEGIFRIFPM